MRLSRGPSVAVRISGKYSALIVRIECVSYVVAGLMKVNAVTLNSVSLLKVIAHSFGRAPLARSQ